MARRIEVEVADKGLDLIVEINSCYRQLHEMKIQLENQERTLRDKIRTEYEDLVKQVYIDNRYTYFPLIIIF